MNKSIYFRWKVRLECIEVVFSSRERNPSCLFIFNEAIWFFPNNIYLHESATRETAETHLGSKHE